VGSRAEANLIFPGATVFDRKSHEGAGTSEAGDPAVPWSAQDLGIDASEASVLTWYANWLSSHGWTHGRDQHPTDSSGAKVEDMSSWTRGDESFDTIVNTSARGRSRFGALTPQELLVTTDYMAPSSVLGCQ
jgi:hypothetical protein